jgi:ribokinase
VTVVVFGSINMDMVTRVVRLPRPGETVAGEDFTTAPGGKGANQAVAAARLGAATRMVGRVGNDLFGTTLCQNLAVNGVDTSAVAVTPGPSGVAAISVDRSGENTIVVVPGANGAVSVADADRLSELLDGARVLMLQFEVPLAAVTAAARVARARGVMVILDPAPAYELPEGLYPLVDLITPNTTEAAILVGFALTDDAAIERAGKILQERTGGTAIIKLGARGAFAATPDQTRWFPAFPVTAVDTVAAGDAFNGGLAAALSAGLPLEQAIRWGLAAGAIAVTRPGAQAAMPTRAELLVLLG